jgi:solute:Na+ symporter, SSS family
MIVICTILYLALNVLIGFWSARKVKNAADFAVAGRGLSVLVASTSIFATWFGAETVMSSSGLFAKDGFGSVIRDPFGAALCLLLIGVVIARPLYKLGVVTFSDYFRIRYGRSAELVSAGLMSYSYLSWIAGQLLAMGNIIHAMTAPYAASGFHLPVWVGVLAGSVIIALYTCVGGMWAVSLTDFMQAGVILAGLILLLGSLLMATGGLSPVIAAQPEGFFSFAPKPADVAIGLTFTDALLYLSCWLTIGFSFAQQDVLQRVMSTKNANDARRSAIYAGIMYVTIAMFPLLIGMCGKFLYPALMNTAGENAHEGLILRIVQEHSGLGLNILFFGALTSAIMSTASGAILSPATVITENIIRPWFPKLKDKQLLFTLRTTVVVVTGLAAYSAMSGKSIYELNADASAILLVTFTVPILFGIYWKRASLTSAWGAMLGGFAAWLLFLMYSNEQNAGLAIFAGLLSSFVLGLVLALLFPNQHPEPQPIEFESAEMKAEA